MKRPISATLTTAITLSLAFPPSAFPADATTSSPSISTSIAQGATSMLGDVNGMFSAFGQSSAQLNALAAQLMQLQQKTQGMGQQQSAFDQIQAQLSNAMAQANACVMQASTNNYDKYLSKRPTSPQDQKAIAKNLTPQTLTSVEPTCSTYGVILDSIEMNKAKMMDENKKMGCLMNLQARIGQIAEQSKAPFNALNQAANEVWKTYTSIIDTHQQIADKIANDVDGPADKDGNRTGKGGYREELNKLKGMALELNNVLNAKPGQNQDGLKYGLVKQVQDLKQQRASAANKWYFSLMQDVEYCYHNEPAPCFANDVSLPPDQCIGAVIQNGASGSGTTAGRRARAQTDAQGLANLSLKNYVNATKINLPANIDVTKPDEFLSFTQVRFKNTLAGVTGAYRSHHFSSDVDQGQLVNFVQSTYQACYDKAVSNFKADMISKGGRYYQDLQAEQDAERETANDIKNWLDRVQGEMTTFRTQFQKVYNSDLVQFKTDCTAEGDPEKSLDCLRVFNAELQSGIGGQTVRTKLSNGTMFTSAPSQIEIPIQTLTLDAQGKPTIGNATIPCTDQSQRHGASGGFDGCINALDNLREQHVSAIQSSTRDRQKFVDQHNQATKQSFSVIASAFGQISSLLTSGVTGINQDLDKLGINAHVKTKQVEGEDLKENEKTGLYDMPKSMKAALAGQNSYTEIDDTQSVTDAFNQLLGDLNKKASEAQKMKNKCKIAKSDYEALASMMPKDCSKLKDVCNSGSGTSSRLTQMQSLFNRSKSVPDDNNSQLNSNSDFQRCKSEYLSMSNSVTLDDIKAAARRAGISISNTAADGTVKRNEDNYDTARDLAVAAKKTDANRNIQANCGDVVFPPLMGLAGQGRPPLDEQNKKIIASLQDVSSACSKVEMVESTDSDGKKVLKMPDSDEDVTSACQAFKDAANRASPPSGEEPTGTAASSTSSFGGSDVINPFIQNAK